MLPHRGEGFGRGRPGGAAAVVVDHHLGGEVVGDTAETGDDRGGPGVEKRRGEPQRLVADRDRGTTEVARGQHDMAGRLVEPEELVGVERSLTEVET